MKYYVSAPERIIKEYRKMAMRKFRHKSRKMLLEGAQLLGEALRAGITFESLIYTPDFASKSEGQELLASVKRAGVEVYQIDVKIFDSLAQTESPQGIAAIARIPEIRRDVFQLTDSESNLDSHPQNQGFYLILDRIQDPGNLGTIIRTAAAADVKGIILLQGTVDPYSPKVLRASMGGIFYLPLVLEANLPEWYEIMKEQGIRLIAADPEGEAPYYGIDLLGPCAVIIGNESSGVEESLLRKADMRAHIPLRGKLTALNAAVAAVAFILENQRQRDKIEKTEKNKREKLF